MSIAVCQVDAFADGPFTGNPAAVCFLEGPASEVWMQRVAAEMNLSETAFLEPRGERFGLRWFTPVREVDLCGHATLASAHALYASGRLPPEAEARFETRSGLLAAALRDGWIEMDLPAWSPEPCSDPPGEVLAAAGVEPVAAAATPTGILLELAGESAVRGLEPDFARLGRSGQGLMVTSRSEDPAFDFVSRYFAPALGIDEDPVTGSAHCSLGPWWRERLGKDEMTAWQASSRGGLVRLRVGGERIGLAGRAVTVFEGRLSEAAAPGTRPERSTAC